MVMAIASSFGPCGRGVLVSRESGSPGILWKGSDIAREMPAPEGTAGIAPRMLKETLFAFDRDHRDGSSRLAVMAEACLRALMREERAGTTAPHLADTMAGLVAGMSDTLQSELRVPTNLVQVAHGSGLSDALATDLASLVAEMGADTAFDITQVNEPCFNITRTEGFTLEVKTLGNAALPALSAVNIMVADEIIRDFGSICAGAGGLRQQTKGPGDRLPWDRGQRPCNSEGQPDSKRRHGCRLPACRSGAAVVRSPGRSGNRNRRHAGG